MGAWKLYFPKSCSILLSSFLYSVSQFSKVLPLAPHGSALIGAGIYALAGSAGLHSNWKYSYHLDPSRTSSFKF